MPYIKPSQRAILRGAPPLTPGELNYMVTALVDTYLSMFGVGYERLNDCIGALECAKLELYRRIAAPYEDAKCAENGDVYTVRP